MTDSDLFRHTAAEGQGAAFVATREGGRAMVEPITERAAQWLRTYANDEATWLGETLIVELRYFPALADAAIGAGFLFERHALPN